MAKSHLKLQASEAVVVQAASQIYAAYITTGRVTDGDEAKWMRRSIREALQIAAATDQAIVADDEVDSLEGRQALGQPLHIEPPNQ